MVLQRTSKLVTHFCLVNQPTLRRLIGVALFFSIVSLLVLSYRISSSHFHSVVEHVAHVNCQPLSQLPAARNDSSEQTEQRVLVFLQTQYSRLGQEVVAFLEANHFAHRAKPFGKMLPSLTLNHVGRYSLVVFEHWELYFKMDHWYRTILDKYCRHYGVGMVLFGSAVGNVSQLAQLPVVVRRGAQAKAVYLNTRSEVLRILRPGQVLTDGLPEVTTYFESNHSSFEPISFASFDPLPSNDVPSSDADSPPAPRAAPVWPVLLDYGLCDGIQKVFFGDDLNLWLNKLILLDAVSFLTRTRMSFPLERYLMIDIDDIFVGEIGTRMKVDDVMALLDSQKMLSQYIDGFRYNLGFSGKFYHYGDEAEDQGDDALIEHRDQFWWFDHAFDHMQPHSTLNASLLITQMKRNYNFAKEHGIPVNSEYAVAPHHSGVYPVHEPLYEAWKRVWSVKVTSTEEYPHLRPARRRAGFIYRNIMVLPRQTCGLFTHTIFLDKYPGGKERLDQSFFGGELFQTIAFNPVNIFMTHLSNYGNDRLGIYTFSNVVRFVAAWTHLRLKAVPPVALAKKYFEFFPEEKDPIWVNPCLDKRHLDIWSKNESYCERLPKFVIIGPQKTGTTALYTFLNLHPLVHSSFKSQETFEEVQFFSGGRYYRGLDWYLDMFPWPNETVKYQFEKSANYFDNELVPRRVAALLPRAKLVTILLSPSQRAYSWYQHMRAHEEPMSLNYSFYEVVAASEQTGADPTLLDLRNRCLGPGMYALHLERWLSFFPSNQLLIIDGNELRSNPAAVLNRLQRFLKTKPYLDYSKLLKFDPKKGFFCQVTHGSTQCLGRSKGRKYPSMDEPSANYLREFYKKHNVQLIKLLNRLGYQIPEWLESELVAN